VCTLPGGPACGSGTSRRSRRTRPWPYGPGRGRHRLAGTVREFLRGYEDSGVDEIILLLNPRSHEGTMESIELMAKRCCPSSSNATKRPWRKRRSGWSPLSRRSRRDARTEHTAIRRNYSFGGLPTGRGGNFTASEIPEAMAEINEGRVQAAQRAKEERK